MANYWYWSWQRHLETAVLPALEKIYQVYAQQVVPAMAAGNPVIAPQSYADSEVVMSGLRNEAVAEPGGLAQALAVFTRATCEALYLEATRFLVLLYRRELAFVGQEDSAFLEKGLNLRHLAGFNAYERLRSAAHDRGYVPERSNEATAPVVPLDVTRWYEDLRGFLSHAVETLRR